LVPFFADTIKILLLEEESPPIFAGHSAPFLMSRCRAMPGRFALLTVSDRAGLGGYLLVHVQGQALSHAG